MIYKDPLRDLDSFTTLTVAFLLVAQVGLYLWTAPRGFEFTDESYYFLNYLYWRDLTGTMSFFGAYLEWPFRMLGQSVTAIRIFSLSLLLASSAFFMRGILAYVSRQNGSTSKTPWGFVVAGMTASLFYFGPPLNTLRAPSYNLLVLCSMLVSTGLLLRILDRSAHPSNARVSMFCYGLAIGACGLSKATSGVMLLFLHALFFALANRNWRLKHFMEFVVLAIAGVGMNFLALQLAHPHWLEALYEGIKLVSMDGSHNLLDSVKSHLWKVQELAPIFLAGTLAAGVTGSLLAWWIIRLRRTALSVLVVVLIGCCAFGLMWVPIGWWLPLLGLPVLLLGGIEILNRKPIRLRTGDLTDFALMALLFALPIAFSFGTNMSVLAHSRMVAVFPVTAILLMLLRLERLAILVNPAVVVCLAALCLPTLVFQLKAATDIHYTYRQLSALGKQSFPVRLGAADNTLLVDAATRETLQSIIGAARAAGLPPGQAILDFTGDGPGLIYAIGGQPMGQAWLLGGYPGSQAIATRVVETLPVQALRKAWLLSSDNNPRAINGWQKILEARVGPDTHALVATVAIRAPYRWGEDAPDRLTVQIWEPRGR